MPFKKLATYRAKRDFNQTREPSGTEKLAAGRRLRALKKNSSFDSVTR